MSKTVYKMIAITKMIMLFMHLFIMQGANYGLQYFLTSGISIDVLFYSGIALVALFIILTVNLVYRCFCKKWEVLELTVAETKKLKRSIWYWFMITNCFAKKPITENSKWHVVTYCNKIVRVVSYGV